MQEAAAGKAASSAEKRTRRVLEALRVQLRHCRPHRGCSPKEIFGQLLRRCKSRNLSLQVRAALKRAVAEGLVKLVAGRYLVVVPTEARASKPRKIKKASRRRARRADGQSAKPGGVARPK